MSEWIPVTESLPDDDRNVLITVKGQAIPEIGYIDVFRGHIDDRKQYCAWVACDRGYVFPDGEVVAWMELPPKYEVKDDE